MRRSYFVYILTNKSNTLYIGITNNLNRRIYEHKKGLISGFTNRYNLYKLIYFEEYKSSLDAIRREKQLKTWRRTKKIALIKKINPDFKELLSF